MSSHRPRKCVIVYNPEAGKLKGRGSDRLERARRILTEAGYETILAPTCGPGAAVALAREWVAHGADLIVAAGGDGTINEVAEGVVRSAVPPFRFYLSPTATTRLARPGSAQKMVDIRGSVMRSERIFRTTLPYANIPAGNGGLVASARQARPPARLAC
jgi:hypothetical protein